MHFNLDRASLIVGSKFTIFSLFYVVFEGNFLSTSPLGLIHVFGGAVQSRGFCVTGLGGLYLEGLIHGEAYFRNFMVSPSRSQKLKAWKTECEDRGVAE